LPFPDSAKFIPLKIKLNPKPLKRIKPLGIFRRQEIVLQNKSWREYKAAIFSYSPSTLVDGMAEIKKSRS